jgi:hypothetical protein
MSSPSVGQAQNGFELRLPLVTLYTGISPLAFLYPGKRR